MSAGNMGILPDNVHIRRRLLGRGRAQARTAEKLAAKGKAKTMAKRPHGERLVAKVVENEVKVVIKGSAGDAGR